jgi:hypothetical protein
MRRFAIAVLLLLPLAAPVEALTIRDVIELSRAGVSEEVLLALVEVDRGVFSVDTDTIKALHDAGVSQRVIVALVKRGRERPVEEQAPAPLPVIEPVPPQVVVVDHHDAPQVREVVIPVPVYVPVVTIPHRRRVSRIPIESTFVPFQTGPPAVRPVDTHHERSEPVYWGFGGKLRPDAWKPRGHERREK